MEDFSFRSLALTGMFVGIAFWAFSGPKSSDANREPDAVDRTALTIKDSGNDKYKPDIPADGGRDEITPPVNSEVQVVTDEATPQIAGSGATSSEFAKTRDEITSVLTQGDVEGALEIAERKLEESVGAKDTEIAYIGYLHEFIMQNSEDDDVELNSTITAMRGTQDVNVRKFIYEKFQTYSPQLTEDLDREMNEVGIVIN